MAADSKFSVPNAALLVGYMEEALPADEMNRVERMLRERDDWRQALRDIQEGEGGGDHSVATIWRRHRLTCATREQLGAYLSGFLPADEADFVTFHLTIAKCRWCQANLADLQASLAGAEPPKARRKRLFETSLGHLPKS